MFNMLKWQSLQLDWYVDCDRSNFDQVFQSVGFVPQPVRKVTIAKPSAEWQPSEQDDFRLALLGLNFRKYRAAMV